MGVSDRLTGIFLSGVMLWCVRDRGLYLSPCFFLTIFRDGWIR